MSRTAPLPATDSTTPETSSAHRISEDSRPFNDKKVGRSRPKSIFRDAAFVRDIHGFAESVRKVDLAEASVYFSSPFNLIPSGPIISSLGKSRTRPWYRFHIAHTVRRNRTPAQWRDTTNLLRAEYYHAAMRQFGLVHTFTANLSGEIEGKARASGRPLDFLYRRVAERLKKTFPDDVPFWAVLEETTSGRIHLHGEIAITLDRVSEVRWALRKACGEWNTNRQHQIKTEASPDAGWVSYAGKDFWLATPFMRRLLQKVGSPMAITFEGRVLSATREVGRLANTLYDEDRQLIMKLAALD